MRTKIKLPDIEVFNYLDSKLFRYFDMNCNEAINNKTRKKEYIASRQIIAKVLLNCGYNYTEIGNMLYFDHATIINSERKVDNVLTTKYPSGLYEIYSDILVNDYYNKTEYAKIKKTIELKLSKSDQGLLLKWLKYKMSENKRRK